MRPPGNGGTKGGTPVEQLESLGVRVIMPQAGRDEGGGGEGGDGGKGGGGESGGEWAALAGSAGVRAALEESLLLPLRHPEVYREVMKGTRKSEETAQGMFAQNVIQP